MHWLGVRNRRGNFATLGAARNGTDLRGSVPVRQCCTELIPQIRIGGSRIKSSPKAVYRLYRPDASEHVDSMVIDFGKACDGQSFAGNATRVATNKYALFQAW